MSALIEAQRDEIAYLPQSLEVEREARRRADTIILERSRQAIALPAGENAAVVANQAPGHAKSVIVGDDASRPESSLLARLVRWLRGEG